jgi:SAM-dependent methyltransferase
MTSPYEIVPYDDRPVAQTHPDLVWVAARRRGLDLADPTAMRVLELGCAHAVNLIPMAFHLPGSRFVGIDLCPTQIEVARTRIEALGLDNVEVHAADVAQYDPGPEPFDLVIVHGLFSWVPDSVRDRILPLCRRALSPNGIAYVSYNVMPAWGIRGAIRRALLAMTADATDDRARLERARTGLGHLAELDPLCGTAEGALLAQEIAGVRDKSDAYLLHEYLVPHARAYWVDEFAALARAGGLRVVDDVAPTGLDPTVEASTRTHLAPLATDDDARALLADIVMFRQFRATLLCRDDAHARPPPSDVELVESLRLAARPRTDSPDADDSLRWLVDRWPADSGLDELLSATADPDREARVAHLGAHLRAGRLELRPRPLPIAASASTRPRVSALCRFEAAHLPFVTTPLHEYAPVDAFHAALIRHLDGTRDRVALVEALVTDIGAGSLRVAHGPTPDAQTLRAGLPPLVDAALERLRAAGILEPAA